MKSKTHPKKSASKIVKKAQPVISDGSQLPCGALTVTVTRFRSLGALTPLEATLTDWTGFHTPPGVPMPQPEPTLTLVDNNAVVTSQYPIRLIYNLPDPQYVLVGIAWEAVAPNTIGNRTFPEILIKRDIIIPKPYGKRVPGGSCLIVTDNAQDNGNYEYVLIIQDTKTGEIGFFDPIIDNKPEE